MTRHMKRLGKVWINIFPHMGQKTKKLEVRMGSGKGVHQIHGLAVVKTGKSNV